MSISAFSVLGAAGVTSVATSGLATGGTITTTGTITVTAAVQSDQETGSSTSVAVVPGVQQFHPSACKGWSFYDTATGINGSYNVTSNTDNGQNDHTTTWTTAFSSTNYCAQACPWADSGNTAASSWSAQVATTTWAAGTSRVFTTNSNGNTSVGEVNGTFIAVFGDQ